MEFSKVPADQRSTDRKTWGNGKCEVVPDPGGAESGGRSGQGAWAEGRGAGAG